MVAKEIENNPNLGLVLVGFVDDNPGKHKRKVLGYPVLGGQKELRRIIEKKGVSEVIISFRKNGVEKNREIRSLCHGMSTEVDVRQMKLTIS